MEYFIVSKDNMAWFQNRIEFMLVYFFVWKELCVASSCPEQQNMENLQKRIRLLRSNLWSDNRILYP